MEVRCCERLFDEFRPLGCPFGMFLECLLHGLVIGMQPHCQPRCMGTRYSRLRKAVAEVLYVETSHRSAHVHEVQLQLTLRMREEVWWARPVIAKRLKRC